MTRSKEVNVLITNLMDVSIDTNFGKVRTHTNALVLSDRGVDDKSGARYRAHGFRNEAGNPTFDMVLPSFDWTIEPQSIRGARSRYFALCVAGMPSAKPETDAKRGVQPSTPPSTRIELLADFGNDEPLDIERWDGQGWGDALLRKVLHYDHAPYIVLGQQHEVDKVRQLFGIEGVEKIRRDA